MAAVATEAGVSRPTVYRYFADRRALLEATLFFAGRDLADGIAASPPPEHAGGEGRRSDAFVLQEIPRNAVLGAVWGATLLDASSVAGITRRTAIQWARQALKDLVVAAGWSADEADEAVEVMLRLLLSLLRRPSRAAASSSCAPSSSADSCPRSARPQPLPAARAPKAPRTASAPPPIPHRSPTASTRRPAPYGANGPPHAAWCALRRHDPVHRCEPTGYPPFWAITKHADIREISKRPDAFLNEPGIVMAQRRDLRPQRGRRRDAHHHRDGPAEAPQLPQGRGARGSRRARWRASTRRSTRARASSSTSSRRATGEGECDFATDVATAHPLRILVDDPRRAREDEPRILRLTNQLFAADDPELQRPGEDRQQAIKRARPRALPAVRRDHQGPPREPARRPRDRARQRPGGRRSRWVRSRPSATT